MTCTLFAHRHERGNTFPQIDDETLEVTRVCDEPGHDPVFRMEVQEVGQIKGRGLILTGIVEGAVPAPGMELVVLGSDGHSFRCKGIERFADIRGCEVGREAGVFLGHGNFPELGEGSILQEA